MENASKALLIAGGVLMAILVLTVGVYLVGAFRGTSDSYVTKLDTVELQKYNSNFQIYLGRQNITAQEIVTAVNVSQELGKQTMIILGTEETIDWDNDYKNKFLADNITIMYKCTYDVNQDIYDEQGKIKQIIFERK